MLIIKGRMAQRVMQSLSYDKDLTVGIHNTAGVPFFAKETYGYSMYIFSIEDILEDLKEKVAEIQRLFVFVYGNSESESAKLIAALEEFECQNYVSVYLGFSN